MKIKRFTSFGSALLLSLSSLLVFAVPAAQAAGQDCQWTGATDSNFNVAGNWSGCGGSVPGSGDNLIFDNTAVPGITTVTNDISSGSFGSITFQGSGLNSMTIAGNAMTISGGITASRNSTISAPLAISGNQTVTVTGTSITLFLNGVLSGSGNLTKAGTGGLYLSADNSSYTGAITASAGGLYADVNSLGATSAGTTVNAGADLSLNTCTTNNTFAENLTLTGASSDPSSANPKPKLYTSSGSCSGGGAPDETYGSSGNNSSTVTLTGTITLGSDITFASGSKATLTGAITGAHAINLLPGYVASLVINSSSNGSSTANGTYNPPQLLKSLLDDQSAHSVFVLGNTELTIDGKRGDTTITNGATLKGIGTVGILTIANGGKVAPGHSPGCMNTGNLTLSGSFDAEIGGTTACTEYDQLKVTGTVDVTNGTLNTILYNSFKPAAGQKYTIIDNDGNDAVTGTFQNMAEGATFNVSGYVFQITYKGGDGNDVVLSVKSVPGTPDTGFRLITGNPLATLAVTAMLAGVIALIARRHHKTSF